MAGVITRRQTKAVLALLQPDGAKCCPSVCPGPDAPANVRAADADMRIKRELYRQGLEGCPASKALQAAGQTAGLSFTFQGLQMDIGSCLCLTHISQGDPQRLTELLGRPEPDALEYRVLGSHLPDQLLQEDGNGVPCFAHQLDLYTCIMPGLRDYAVAAAKCCLLRPDLFGGTENRHWHKAKAVLQDFLTPSDAAASTECAVVPTLRGTAWPPAPTLQLNGFIHIPWTKAEVHLAPAGSGTTAGVHTAAGAGTAAASGKEGQADEERPAAAPAAAKKSCAPPGKAQTASAAPPQDKPKTSAGGQKGRAAAADQRGPDHHLTLLKLLATSIRSEDPQYFTTHAKQWSKHRPEELSEDMALQQQLEMLYTAHCISPLDDQALLEGVITQLYPTTQLLDHAGALQDALLNGSKGQVLLEGWPDEVGSCNPAAVLDAVQLALGQAQEGSGEQATLSKLAQLLEEQAGADHQGLLQGLWWVPGAWKPVPIPTIGYTFLPDKDSESGGAHHPGNNSFYSSESGSSGDEAISSSAAASSSHCSKPAVLTPGLSRQLLKVGYGMAEVAQLLGVPVIQLSELEPCYDVADNDTMLGLPYGLKFKNDLAGPAQLLKLYHVQTLDLDGNHISHDVASRKWAAGLLTGRPAWRSQGLLNELLVESCATRQDDSMYPMTGLTFCVQHLPGSASAVGQGQQQGGTGGVTAGQLQAWRRHYGLTGEEVPEPLPEEGLVAVYVCQLVPYRGRDVMTLKAELCTTPQFQALEREEQQELLAAVSRRLIAETASTVDRVHIVDGEDTGAGVVIQSAEAGSGKPLLDLLRDIQHGKGTAVYTGVSHCSYLLDPGNEAIKPDHFYRLGRKHNCDEAQIRSMANRIYPLDLVDQRAAAAAPGTHAGGSTSSSTEEVPGALFHVVEPRLALGNTSRPTCDKERLGVLFGSWADLVMCAEAAVEGPLISHPWGQRRMWQDALVWRLRDWPEMPQPDGGYVDSRSVLAAASEAVELSTTKSPALGDVIKRGLSLSPAPSGYGWTLDGVMEWCSTYAEADIELLERYISRWCGVPATM